MDKAYQPHYWEPLIREQWKKAQQDNATYDPERDAFSIVLPPPNANGSLHVGHAMYVYEDIMIRYARQQGKMALWLPGSDHAGFETQYVFEKYLAKQGKSRFDYDRPTLYNLIADFVGENKGTIKTQFESIGFSLDWSKEVYTLDKEVVNIVHQTFKRLFDAGLIYRSKRLVNYCVKDGTSFSDLEIEHKEVVGILYHITYPVVNGGEIVVATTRPETLFGDAAVMVNPKDKRYTHMVGCMVKLPLINREIPIIADTHVDMKFGTGAVKVTPAHDHDDFEVGRRHNLPLHTIIGFNGKLCNTGTEFDGIKVKAARELVLTKLQEGGYLAKTETHPMVVKSCYKCGNALEPLPLEQWYVSVRPLANRAKQAIQNKEIEIHPHRFKKILIGMLDNFIDWNISRQIVWGIQIPAYRCTNTSRQSTVDSRQSMDANEGRRTRDSGLASSWFVSLEKPASCPICHTCTPIQDTDTFDTWFSSGQWPFATLMSVASSKFKVQSSKLYEAIAGSQNKDLSSYPPDMQKALQFFNYFYPTTVLETGYDIARAWVSRMIMLGYFVTHKAPFKHVYLHGMVRDGKGQKMSKSKGNVVDPLKLTQEYGTDALRMALIFGTTPGGDISLSNEKVLGMRNFVNKLWNMGRFIHMLQNEPQETVKEGEDVSPILKNLKSELTALKKKYKKDMEHFAFAQALGDVYEFIWHRFADVYIEQLKEAAKRGNTEVQSELKKTYQEGIALVSPFAPFVCEAISRVFDKQSSNESDIIAH